jgi:hypothetical protein
MSGKEKDIYHYKRECVKLKKYIRHIENAFIKTLDHYMDRSRRECAYSKSIFNEWAGGTDGSTFTEFINMSVKHDDDKFNEIIHYLRTLDERERKKIVGALVGVPD